MEDIRVFIYQVPKNRRRKELTKRLLGIQVRVRGYLLIGTKEPLRPEDALVYLVHNDDLRIAFAERYGLVVARRYYRRQSLPVGQVTRIPVDCCEIKPKLQPEGD